MRNLVPIIYAILSDYVPTMGFSTTFSANAILETMRFSIVFPCFPVLFVRMFRLIVRYSAFEVSNVASLA